MQANQAALQDPETFRDLYKQTQLIIFRFIYGLHGGPTEEVEDLTCDTFLRAWKARYRFKGNNHEALCWLFTIARHIVIDEHRRKKYQWESNNLSIDSENINEAWISTHETPEDKTAAGDQFAVLWELLQKLPDDKREILVLRYLIGWKVKQIAEYIDKEENTVSVMIKRCLEQIRRDWPAEYE
jgi:RNA polymerase sigma-70 factor, ECF subfamily